MKGTTFHRVRQATDTREPHLYARIQRASWRRVTWEIVAGRTLLAAYDPDRPILAAGHNLTRTGALVSAAIAATTDPYVSAMVREIALRPGDR